MAQMMRLRATEPLQAADLRFDFAGNKFQTPQKGHLKMIKNQTNPSLDKELVSERREEEETLPRVMKALSSIEEQIRTLNSLILEMTKNKEAINHLMTLAQSSLDLSQKAYEDSLFKRTFFYDKEKLREIDQSRVEKWGVNYSKASGLKSLRELEHLEDAWLKYSSNYALYGFIDGAWTRAWTGRRKVRPSTSVLAPKKDR